MDSVRFRARVALAALAGLGTLWIGGAVAAQTGPGGGRPGPPAAGPQWPQSTSDIPADPAIRFGVLPNGMRYLVMHNAQPHGVVSIRLLVAAGSIDERDDQQGLAHFLEHMSFRGSKHVPEAEVWQDLQRLGLQLGADTNAFTGYGHTQYDFDLPANDDATLDAALLRLRDTASELTLSQSAMDAERGVILSEERFRDTPDERTEKAEQDFFFQGQRVIERWPIGQDAIIEHAPVTLIRQFYDAYYRPERTVLIVVGDIDPAAMEAKVVARFSDWRAVGPPGPDPAIGTPAPRQADAALHVEPNAPFVITVGWTAPLDTGAETIAARRRSTIEQLGLLILNHRLDALAGGSQPPFVAAGVGRQTVEDAGKITTLMIYPIQGRWRDALDAAERVRRETLTYGVRPEELARAIGELRESMPAVSYVRPSPVAAGEMLQIVENGRSVITSPRESFLLYDQAVHGLTVEQVDAALRDAFVGGGPLVFMSSPMAIDGGRESLAQAMAAADAAPVTQPAAVAAKPWPYTAFGPPGYIVSERTIADLGVTIVTLNNGVQITIKPTTFAGRQVQVLVRVGNGVLDLPKDRRSTLRLVASDAIRLGGLKDMSFEEMQAALTPKHYGETFTISDDGFDFIGETTPQDLDTQLQVLTAYVSAPGWRPQVIERLQATSADQIGRLQGSPVGVLQLHADGLLHDGDLRWPVLGPTSLAADRPEDLKAILGPPLANGAIDVVIVGDVTVEQAAQAVARTFGALPPRPGAPAADATRRVRFPRPTAAPVILKHDGRPDQGVAVVGWPTRDFYSDQRAARTLYVLQAIVVQRLTERLRVAAGAIYTPLTFEENSEAFTGYGFFAVGAEIPPDKMPLFYKATTEVTADLRASAVGADELERARRPLVDEAQQTLQTNAYWLEELTGAARDPRKFDMIRSRLGDLSAVTAEDVRQAARAYLVDSKAWKLEVLPRANPAHQP